MKITTMSSLSKDTLELIASRAEILTVVLALVSAAFGIVTVFANKPLKRIAEREAAEERLKASEAHAKELDAQLKLDQWLAKRVIARTALSQDFDPLKKFPVAKVEVLYKEGDGEAFMYAQTMLQAFREIGWGASDTSTSTSHHPVVLAKGTPIIGTYVVARTGEKDFMEHGGTLLPFATKTPFLPSSRLSTLMAAVESQTFVVDPTMPPGEYRIVVGEYLRFWTP